MEQDILDNKIPRSKSDDYTEEIVLKRREFILKKAGVDQQYTCGSIDHNVVKGNIENYIGTVQVPLGIAGPLLVDGENAQGEFYVPMATSEGALVASYNRGMALAHANGGIKTIVINDTMQRAFRFEFSSAKEASVFGKWITENYSLLKECAEATTSAGKLDVIQQWTIGKTQYVRFNFTTGDAAGQNMVNKATWEMGIWIVQNYSGIKDIGRANMCTDKKTSYLNSLYSRGKYVIAEITIKENVLREMMRTSPQNIKKDMDAGTFGAFFSGSNTNAAHHTNGLTAIFIATGQDVANITEATPAFLQSQITPEGDLYCSLTLPSLIVGTYGGGTGLPSQKECLQMMDCFGKDRAKKFAEIIAATALCGEISIIGAVAAGEFVSAHEDLGRNRK